MPDILVRHLLDRARESLPQGPGAPRQATLRRGTSDAYFALFHHLTDAVARQVLRHVDPTAVRAFRRTVSHAALKRVSESIAHPKKRARPAPLGNPAQADADVRALAQIVVDLQQERHSADYDHEEVFDARRLREAVHMAETAVNEIDRLRPTPSFCAFVGLIALKSDWSSGA